MDLFLEYEGDLVLMCRTSVEVATGWDQIRQRIIRRIITNPAQQLPDGSFTEADYVFDGTYGLGLGSLVGQNFNSRLLEALESRINAGVLADVDVEPTAPVAILFAQPKPDELVTRIGVTLKTGETGQLYLRLTP